MPTMLKQRILALRFFAGEPAGDAPIELNHRRVFILPSARGLSFALLLSLLWLIAFVYNNNLVYLLTFLLASVFFVTILHTYKALAGLVLQLGATRPVFAGEAAGFTLHIRNPDATPRYQIQLMLESIETLTLPAHGKRAVTLYAATHRRGWHKLGKVTVTSSYPLGLFRAWSPLRFDISVLVYPKPAPESTPFPETAVAEHQQGAYKKAADDFYGLQTYQAGDPIKHIHWKAFAKGLGVYSKQYSGGGSAQDVWLDYQQAPGLSTEERLSRLCRWILDAEQAGIRYGFKLPGLMLPPSIGEAHRNECLKALALFGG